MRRFQEGERFHLLSPRVHETMNTVFSLNVFIEQCLARHVSPVVEKTMVVFLLLLCYLENE